MQEFLHYLGASVHFSTHPKTQAQYEFKSSFLLQ